MLAGLNAPLYGVFGNNDLERQALDAAITERGFEFVEPPLELYWHSCRIIVVHDPLEFNGPLRADHALALHGHTHRYRLEQQAQTLFFNPGECAGHLSGHNAVGIVNLATLETQLLKF